MDAWLHTPGNAGSQLSSARECENKLPSCLEGWRKLGVRNSVTCRSMRPCELEMAAISDQQSLGKHLQHEKDFSHCQQQLAFINAGQR